MWICRRERALSGFSGRSTAEEVSRGIDGSTLTAIVTGASRGIGRETARVLALRRVHVIMAVRNVETGEKVKRTIMEENPEAKMDVMELDLASFASVRKFAADYNSSGLPLNILINNAGVLVNSFTLSRDNIELQFATNHLGHFLLTNLLLDNMKKTARKSQVEGRIVNVSSVGHLFAFGEGVRFDKITGGSRSLVVCAYSLSKLANVLHANELANRFKEEGVEITANSLHPGIVSSTSIMQHTGLQDIFNWVGKYLFKDIHQGAATTCYVALHPQVKGVSGRYFSDCNVSKMSRLASDAKLAKKLWDLSLNITGPSIL